MTSDIQIHNKLSHLSVVLHENNEAWDKEMILIGTFVRFYCTKKVSAM